MHHTIWKWRMQKKNKVPSWAGSGLFFFFFIFNIQINALCYSSPALCTIRISKKKSEILCVMTQFSMPCVFFLCIKWHYLTCSVMFVSYRFITQQLASVWWCEMVVKINRTRLSNPVSAALTLILNRTSSTRNGNWKVKYTKCTAIYGEKPLMRQW